MIGAYRSPPEWPFPASQASDFDRPHSERLLDVSDFVEKPKPEVAPSNLAVAGRYILTPAVFDHIRQQPKGAGGEIQLTDGIAALIGKETVLAYSYFGERYDCGSKLGLLQATVDLGLAHPELGAEFKNWLSLRS